MRERCQILIALGDCATFGGIVATRNLVGTDAALKRAYIESESTVDGLIPNSPELGVPLDHVTGVDEVVKVDLFIPGCPPGRMPSSLPCRNCLPGSVPGPACPNTFGYD